MHPEKLTLTRKDLYEKVWTTPMLKLARGFGLSDVGLAKLCRRHRIPVPGRGYWARLAAGHKLSRPPLPQNDDPRLDIIEIRPTDRPAMEGSPMQEKQPIPAIEVAPGRPLTHPLALEVERSVLRSTDERGLLLARKGRAVPVRVSPGSLPSGNWYGRLWTPGKSTDGPLQRMRLWGINPGPCFLISYYSS